MLKNLKNNNRNIAVVVFNLGGPDDKRSIKPFLFNLFNDKYILNIPRFFRYFVAWFIVNRRIKKAQKVYSHLNNQSPIFKETQAQAHALEKSLQFCNDNYKVFICMRHWHPMSHDVVNDIIEYKPDEVVLLPLYPQFSTTTTLSAIEDFFNIAKQMLPDVLYKTICCYFNDKNFIESHTELINTAIHKIKNIHNCRVIFSAHGLPEKIIKSGDPYQWQIEKTVKSIITRLSYPLLDYKISYQSKVGPLEWIGPNTEDEIKHACTAKKEIMIIPIAFVNEHSETLVELDKDYKDIADGYGINYVRVPTLSMNSHFIASLKNMVIDASQLTHSFISSNSMQRVCPKKYIKCPYQN